MPSKSCARPRSAPMRRAGRAEALALRRTSAARRSASPVATVAAPIPILGAGSDGRTSSARPKKPIAACVSPRSSAARPAVISALKVARASREQAHRARQRRRRGFDFARDAARRARAAARRRYIAPARGPAAARAQASAAAQRVNAAAKGSDFTHGHGSCPTSACSKLAGKARAAGRADPATKPGWARDPAIGY